MSRYHCTMHTKRLPHQLKAPCPCASERPYAECCAPWHAGAPAPTPEALMRSRYSAYALGDVDYLLSTWHPSTAPGELELGFTKWVGLEVLHAEQSGDAGVVEFVARYKVNGKAEKLHEVSRFVCEQGRWLYIDGQQPEAAP
jgi:SEC-C motif domain protein